MAQLSESEILFIVLVVSAGMLLLISAIIVFVVVYQKRMYRSRLEAISKQQEFDQRMITAQLESQEAERRRIGSDLHDSLGSLLWGAKVNASIIQKYAGMGDQASAAHSELVKILDESIESVRRIAWELTPEAFHHIGFYKSVERLCHQYNRKEVPVGLEGELDFMWNDDRAIQAFRIVQELLVNAVKHAHASQILVKIDTEGESKLFVTVRDDGQGIKPSEVGNGLGWWSIHKRVAQLNGKIIIGIPPMGKGTKIELTIPLANEQE